MAELPLNLEMITEASLVALVETNASESVTLEFKSELYGGKDENKKEFLKDVSAMANTAGGILLIGIKEDAGVAKAITPIEAPDTDKAQQFLNSLLQNGLEPRIFGVQIKSIPVNGGYVLALRIPPSSIPPHRVTTQNSNRFYMRSSTGAYEASYSELRDMFVQNSNAYERVSSFRSERLDLLNMGLAPKTLASIDDRLVLHIIPQAGRFLPAAIDLTIAQQNDRFFRPLNSTGYSPSINFEGFIVSHGGSECRGYTQVFRNGTLEAVCVGILSTNHEEKVIYGRKIQKLILDRIEGYFTGMKTLEITPPLFVAITLQNIKESEIKCASGMFDYDSVDAVRFDNLFLPICVLDDYGNTDKYIRTIRPALDALWNAAGYNEWQPENQPVR